MVDDVIFLTLLDFQSLCFSCSTYQFVYLLKKVGQKYTYYMSFDKINQYISTYSTKIK